MKIKIIAAMGKNRELGKDNGLPDWKLTDDMKRFKELTTGGTVVMGRKSFESLPEKFRPLPNRKNIVLTRDKNWKHEGVEVAHTVEEIMEKYKNEDTLWIIGGAEIYKQFLEQADEIHLTHVDFDGEADTFFPEFSLVDFKEIHSEKKPADEKNSHRTEYKVFSR